MPHHNIDTHLNPKYYSYTDTVDFLEAIDFKLLFCTLNFKTMVDKLILKSPKIKMPGKEKQEPCINFLRSSLAKEESSSPMMSSRLLKTNMAKSKSSLAGNG